MQLDPSIILAGLRNQGGDEILQGMQIGQQMGARRQQMQMQQMEYDQKKRMLKDEEDTRNAYRMSTNPQTGEIDQSAFLTNLGRLGQGQLAEKYKTQWIEQKTKQTKEKAESQKAEIELKRAQAEEVSRRAFSAIQAFNQGDVRTAQDIWTESGMPGGFDIQLAHKEFNKGISTKDQMEAIMKQQGWAREDKKTAETPLTDIAKLNADLKAGRISQQERDAAIKKATTHGALVNVGYSQPFEVADPSGKTVLVQQDKQGNIRPVQGYIPKEGQERPLTEAQGNAVAFLNRSQEALKAYEPASKYVPAEWEASAFGVTGGNRLLSNRAQQVLNAQREFVSGVLRKESGAAISADEWKNYGAMYFPRAGDSKEVIKQKENQRKRILESMAVQAGPGVKQLERKQSESKRITATGPGGKKLELRDGKWVEI